MTAFNDVYSISFSNKQTECAHSILCFGDIHGHCAAAEAAVSRAEDLGTTAVFLGDFIDRGPDSAGVLRVMMDASQRHPDWVFLIGNHDWMLKEILEGRRHSEEFDERTFKEILPCLPPAELPNILEWLKACPAFYRFGNFLFVHGGFIDARIPIDHVPPEELVWTFGISDTWYGETVIRGHAVVDRVEIKTRNVNINTGCGFGGFLTALLLESTSSC
jgi:serine/threonine protein phosphatase 1